MEILDRTISLEGDVFVVLESTKKTYTKEDLINELQNIQRQKYYLTEQNKKLKQDYDNLVLMENEIKSLLEESYVDGIGDL